MTTDYASVIASAVGRLNVGDVTAYMSRLYAVDCRFHGYPESFTPDYVGIGSFYRALVTAVPDACITPQDLLVDADRVAIRYTFTGTHQGELLGAPGSGRALSVEGMTLLQFGGGLVVERWNRLDDLTLLTQLGALPAMVGT
ncbi:MAG: hypothetical protein NVSMB13_13210 [Mycobacteriales bacterium]